MPSTGFLKFLELSTCCQLALPSNRPSIVHLCTEAKFLKGDSFNHHQIACSSMPINGQSWDEDNGDSLPASTASIPQFSPVGRRTFAHNMFVRHSWKQILSLFPYVCNRLRSMVSKQDDDLLKREDKAKFGQMPVVSLWLTKGSC
eukprot:1423366-Amphidinium_carterae.2